MHRAAAGRLRDLLPHPGAGGERGGGSAGQLGGQRYPGPGAQSRAGTPAAAPRYGAGCRARAAARRGLPHAPFLCTGLRAPAARAAAASPPPPGAAPRHCTARHGARPATVGAAGSAVVRHPRHGSPAGRRSPPGCGAGERGGPGGEGDPDGAFSVPRRGNGAPGGHLLPQRWYSREDRLSGTGKALPWEQGPRHVVSGNAVTAIAGRVQNEVVLPFPLNLRQKITYRRIVFSGSGCAAGKKATLL